MFFSDQPWGEKPIKVRAIVMDLIPYCYSATSVMLISHITDCIHFS